MASEKKKSSVKNLTRFISSSSQKLLAAFLNDDIKLKSHQEALQQEIHQACKQNSFVVLQINQSLDPHAPFETVSGKLKFNQNNPQIVILAEQQTDKIRMVPLEHIRKISFIKPRVAKKRQPRSKIM